MLHYPAAMQAANLMWSTHWPEPEQVERASRELPEAAGSAAEVVGEAAAVERGGAGGEAAAISIAAAATAPTKTEQWDLQGLATEEFEASGKAVVVERLHCPEQDLSALLLPYSRERQVRQPDLLAGGRFARWCNNPCRRRHALPAGSGGVAGLVRDTAMRMA